MRKSRGFLKLIYEVQFLGKKALNRSGGGSRIVGIIDLIIIVIFSCISCQ